MKHLTTISVVHVLFMYCLCAMRLGHHAVFSIPVFLFLFCLSYIQTQNNSGDWLTSVSEDHSHGPCCSFGAQMSCHHWVDHSMFLEMTALVQVEIKWSTRLLWLRPEIKMYSTSVLQAQWWLGQVLHVWGISTLPTLSLFPCLYIICRGCTVQCRLGTSSFFSCIRTHSLDDPMWFFTTPLISSLKELMSTDGHWDPTQLRPAQWKVLMGSSSHRFWNVQSGTLWNLSPSQP